MWRARNSNRKKSWNAPASRVRHSSAGMRARSTPSTRMRPRVRLVQLARSFTSVVLPAPFSPTMATTAAGRQFQVHVLEHEALGAGIGERDVLEANAAASSRAGTGRSADATSAAA